ncbi:unnamed protein product [Rotaria socialis]|uniref:Hydrocephalus-inducing protein n=1 Tax=Rotaria socialis TaxID=392032 RepID=A0A817U4D9_9BILA|nr:unnamed protein product [Rotaria socialis]CAF4502205.1 unnamed protein product [Rotaria socialis]
MLFDQKANMDTGGASVSLQTNYESKVTAPRNPTLNRGPKIEPKLTPSSFLKEMSLDTQQKLLYTREMYLPKIISLSDMAETSLQTTTKVDIDEPLFQPYPSDITFQKYEPFNTYEVPLLLRNNDKVARIVKVSQADTPYFTIVTPPNAYQKVAPGVALVFRIQFKPEEQRDYAHEILVATEREKFLVPIRAIGARAILDFPDSITFPTTAVKSNNMSKVLFVRNIGNREARFVLQINKPFHVSPENGLLSVGESMQVTIDFHPTVNGEMKDELVILYDTGEKVYVNAYGVAQDINVRLEKRSIHFENTYLEMVNQRTVTLSNRSDQLVHFQWKQYATEREEEQHKLRQLHALSDEEVNALQKLNVNSSESPSAGPFDFGVLIQRTFINHRRQLSNESYLFTNTNFRIDPLEGDLWPGGTLDIQVLFKPSEARKYEQLAWLDVVGREQRLPLTLTGEGEGAKLESSFQTLDIGCVYVGSTHLYEVVLANKGFIDARYRIRNSNSMFGSCFQLDPSAGTVSMDNYQAIQITFHSEQLGQFHEVFNVEIEGNPNPLIVAISGQVIGPTFYFDQAQLKFGLVSYGFQTTLGCHLFNTSLVPMPFRLHIDKDKHNKPNLVAFDDEEEEEEEITNDNEFQIRPSRGNIPPQSDTKVYVDFIPKSIQKYDTFLQVDIDGVGRNIFSLPITAKSTVPRITLHTEILDLGRTFLNNPNQRYVRLQNSTSLPMRYQFLYPGTETLHFESAEGEGVIDANTTRDVPLTITIKQLGDITEKVEIHRVGARDPSLELEITATGTGPVLFIDPGELRFGTISVLDEHTQMLSLSNESPIPAVFHCDFDKKNSCFSCVPNYGVVEPHTSIEVRVIARLNDRLKFNEELIIFVDHSSPRSILITAQGTGALIVPDVPIFPSLNLGSRFVGTSIVQRIHFTNKGRRHLAVHFIPAGDTTAAYGVQRKTKASSKDSDLNRASEQIFRLEPERLEFSPGETRLLTVTGFAAQPKTIDEIFTCLAIIGRSTGRDKLLSLKIHCEFVEPLMSFSKTDLYFRVEYNEQTIADGLRTPVSSELTFSNISAIDLTANLRVKHPFLLKTEANDDSSSTSRLDSTDETLPEIPPGFTLTKKIKILTGMSYVEHIYFDPSANTKELSWKCDEQVVFTYEEHAFNDIVSLHGEVHYPNLLIEHADLNFGCILNGTEVTRYVTMVNVSPLPVKYLWAFILDENDRNYSFEPQPQTNISSPQLNQTQIQSGPWSENADQPITYDTTNTNPKLEEIFDISPFFGCLQPGEIEKTAVRFYGHPGIKTAVKAICQVENGPVYELYLHGQASYMAYRLNTHEIDFGDIYFDKTATHTLTLTSVGLVPLDFQILNLSNLKTNQQHEQIDVEPQSGECEAFSSTVITVKFLPNVPEKFEKVIYLQVAHFQPDEVRLIGTGMFSRLDIDLPRYIINNSVEEQLYEQIKEKFDEKTLQHQLDTVVVQTFVQKSNEINPHFMEFIGQSPTQQQLQLQSLHSSNASLSSSSTSLSKRSVSSKSIPILPDYLVDFSYIILGTVRQNYIRVKNPTNNNITFRFDRLAYKNTGFSFDCDHVKNLPPGEYIRITVTFDPRGANLELGPVELRVPVEVTAGPTFHLRLKAIVTMPDLNVSNDTLDFATVKCGECKIATIQLKNPQEIRCEWVAIYPGEDTNSKQVGRFPRRGNISTSRRKPSTRIFEVLPPSGSLLPGQKTNVQIKFTPTEEINYESRVLLRINQSSQRLMIICRGVGLEPQIIIGQMHGDIFEPTTSIIFNPILTHSQGDEQDIVLRNPCMFPIEIYNLEFDKQYLEEEKILRLLPGYDENNNILLPTRAAGDKLPAELQKFHDDVIKRAEEEKQGEAIKRTEETPYTIDGIETNGGELASSSQQPMASAERAGDRATSNSIGEPTESIGDKSEFTLKRVAEKIINYDMTPVAQALARHLGIDLTSDGIQARNRRGISVIVHGPPGSGKTMISREISERYDCALLNLDQVIIDAIDSAQRSEFAQRAYLMCRDAFEKNMEEQRQTDTDVDHAPAAQLAAHNKKVSDKKKKGAETTDPTTQTATFEAQPLTSPLSVRFKIHKNSSYPLDGDSVEQSRENEDSQYVPDDQEELMTFVLTEDIFVEILAARLQRADCIHGVVFDSLDTSFLANPAQTAIAVLKAINNRSYIYGIITNFSYSKYKEAQARADEIRRFEEQQREQTENEYVEEMGEDEYDALPEEEKQRIDQKRLQRKKDRILREQRNKEEKLRLEQERIILKEAELQKTKKKPGSNPAGGKGGIAPASGSEKGTSAATGITAAAAAAAGGKTSARPTLISARGPPVSDRSNPKTEVTTNEESEKKKAKQNESKPIKDSTTRDEIDIANNLAKASITSDGDDEKEKKKDRELLVKFKTFEYYRNDLLSVFDLWDRTKGITRSPPTPTNQSEEEHVTGAAGTGGGAKKNVQKKDKAKKSDTKDREKVERAEDSGQPNTPNQQQSTSTPTNFDESGQPLKDEQKKQTPLGADDVINIPTIQIDTPVDYSSNQSLPSELMDSIKNRLPSLDLVLDGMGQGPRGPPVPKPFDFAVVPFPEPRINPPCAEYGQYFFVATHENDPNLYPEDGKLKDGKTPEPTFIGEDADGKDTGPKGRRSRGDRESITTKRKASGGPIGSTEGKSTTRGTSKGGRYGGKQSPTHHSSDGQDGTSESSVDKLLPRIVRFRWIIPANSEIRVRLRFISSEVGQFDQTVSFEIVGTKRNYKVFCRGVCTFPSISREPRTVFPNRQKTRKPNEIVHKKFILSTEQYDFGPLVLGKDINKIRSGTYQTNVETLTIDNTSPMDVEALFCFLYEVEPSKAAFFLDPTEMHLKSGESKQLKIIANPPREGHFDDSLVICIKENPEPIVYKLSCDGCTPELQIEPTSFDFGQVLLYRKESRVIKLKNAKLIPVKWRLIGIGQEGIGQEFSTKTDTGVVEPMSTYELQLNYYASRPRSPASIKNKLSLKLEISDTDGMPGAIKAVNIPVFVEPYDIVLDMTFQKGNDRGIDFGNVRVNQETKQSCALKNKGKREIKYKFELVSDPKSKVDASKFFEIAPKQGTLPAGGDRNAQFTSVNITFKPTTELQLREAEIIVVSVINVAPSPKGTESGGQLNQSNTHIGASQSTLKGGSEAVPIRNAAVAIQQPPAPLVEEEVARIRLKISAKATYSRFLLMPEREVNFGPMPMGTSRRIEKFIIENHGEHDFKYIIQKYQREVSPQKLNIKDYKKISPPNRADSAMSAKTVRKYDQTRDAPTQGRLQVGPFIISPAFAMIMPNGNTTVSVECIPESDVPRKFEEEILIDIADRNPTDYPQGVIYKLKSELIVPQIDTSDLSSIFEEHRLVRNLSSFQNIADSVTGGVYGEEERRFQFRNVIVGRTSKARYKITNSQKVPVDITLALRPTNKGQRVVESFELDVTRAQIPPYSSHYAVVSFTPASMQSYSAMFDVIVDGQLKTAKETRITPNFTFEINGEGHLPRVSIIRPAIRNKKAQTMMIFNKLLLGRQASLQLLLINDGVLPAKVDFYLHDVENVFSLEASNENPHPEHLVINDLTRKATAASAIFEVGKKIALDVVFKPKTTQGPQRYEGALRLVVVDNQYEDTIVQLIGESYTDDITLDNIHGLVMADEPLTIESGQQTIVEEDAPVALSNTINFGEIHLNESRQILFSITNHHQKDSVRFEWPDHPQCTFSPRVGHLHAGCTKDVQVTFKTNKPIQLTKEKLLCSIIKITFDRPVNEVPDWDDRMRSVKWIDVSAPATDSTNAETQRSNRPARKKVVEADIEPAHQRIEEQTRILDIYASAIADYCRYKCSEFEIRYFDTAILQTRIHEVTITNRGKVSFHYAWQVHMEDSQRPFTPMIDRDPPTPEPTDGTRKGHKGGVRSQAPNAPATDALNAQESSAAAPPGSRGKDKTGKDAGKSTGKDGPTGSKTKGARQSVKSNVTAESLAEEKDNDNDPAFFNEPPNTADMLRGDSESSARSPPSVMTDVGYAPFMIEPDTGSIAVGATQVFKIKFAPLDVNDYQARLTCCIPNLETAKAGPIVAVRGRSILPFCHFELEESDYLTSGRRRLDLLINNGSPQAPAAFVDRQTRVMEFKAVGIGSTLNKSFSVLNPTDADYTYRWICEDNLDLTKQPSFVCRTLQGKIASGKGVLMSFDFFPRSFGIIESAYRFEIPAHSLSVPFLLVGQVNEPQILFDRTFVSFHPALIGHHVEETLTLINKENRSFHYQFLERCFINGTTNTDLIIEPAPSGVVPPNTRLPLHLIFRPKQNRAYTYVLQCRIDETIELLNVNVKGEGFANLSSVHCETIEGNRYELTSSQTGTNEIHFDDVLIGNIASRQIQISNDGKYAFDFNWFSDNEQELTPFSMAPMKGTISNSQKQTCLITFEPRTREHRALIQRSLHLNIVNGLKYDLSLIGKTTTPNIEFSFLSFNFGPCFVYRAGMPENICELLIQNKDSKDHTIECLYQSTAQLMFDFKTGLIPSKQTTACRFTFYPREQKIYRETIQFEIDGLTIVNVIIEGEGVDFRVELAEPKHKILNLGALQAGKNVTREVCLVNRSRAHITNCYVVLNSSETSTVRENLTVLPTNTIALKARGGTQTVTVKFSPRSRLAPFVEQIFLKYGDLDVPMFAVRGCCQGYDISLDSDTLPFGAVGKDCSLTRKLILSNRGDIGASFAWNLAQLRDVPFRVSPTNGYIAPGQEATIEFVFQPRAIRHDIRCDRLECRLEGTQPVTVTLSGSCVEVAPARETIVISTAVRSKELSKSILLKNNTNTLWTLTPIISGEYFSGPETVIIELNSTKNYELTYLPLTEGKHTGTLFFPLPDGNGLLYNVIGNAEAPRASGKFTREVPCKTPFVELLPIENWLKKPQRFRVTHEITKQDRPEVTTTIKYLEFIDVAPKSKRDFKLQFYSYKECVQQIKVIFKNEQTQEYVWYDITFKSIVDKRNAPTIANIDLTTHVRQQTSHDIILENPLPNKVTFQGQCSHSDILLPPEQVSIPANSQGSFNFTYMPLKAGKVETRLEMNSVELGLYTYMLTLNALPARSERTLYFKAPLGNSQVLTAKFTSYARTKTDYVCKIDHPDFIVDRTVTAAPSSSPSTMEVSVDVTYEPSQLGDVRATLTISSPSSSDYTFPLVGLGELPKPQGPFSIKAGNNTTITFKNIFAQALTYAFNVDNPLFHVTKSQELIQARKSHRIVVSFDGSDTVNKADVMAKLIISCPKTTGATNSSSSSVQWIYYLKGVTP